MKIIGIAGVAGAGKDTFYSLLSQRMFCKRASFADFLKKEVRPWGGDQYGIDPCTCSREEKEIIRPFLVFHGNLKRALTNGRYWIETLDMSIKASMNQGILDKATLVITDVRYDEYNNDEVDWLKNELGGTLVHLSQYEWETSPKTGEKFKIFRPPVNLAEKENDPRLKEKADYVIEWEYLKSGQIEELNYYIDNFMEWFETNVTDVPRE